MRASFAAHAADATSPDRVLDAMLLDLRRHVGSKAMSDDVTSLLLRVRPDRRPR